MVDINAAIWGALNCWRDWLDFDVSLQLLLVSGDKFPSLCIGMTAIFITSNICLSKGVNNVTSLPASS